MPLHLSSETLHAWLTEYGYWALMAALLLESAGIPVPGETVLVLASVIAAKHAGLSLQWIIVVGTFAATLGDNLGFAVGTWGGRPLLNRYGKLFHIPEASIQDAQSRLQQHGGIAIFVARFLPGVRVVAGPVAGVLHLPWKKFVLFNFLGASTWVTTIASAGYFGGSQMHRVARYSRVFELAAITGLISLALWLGFHRFRHKRA